MKALIAATCIAVLAAVGHYFWSEYEARAARSAERARLERVATEKELQRVREVKDCNDFVAEVGKGDYAQTSFNLQRIKTRLERCQPVIAEQVLKDLRSLTNKPQ